MRYKGLDLNLLAALDILFKERSVSASARRLNVSQPAVSAALARLRAAFNDQLLVSSGNRMLPTERAGSMMPLLAEVMEAVERLMLASAPFDPATSRRRFRLIASDYISTVLLTPLLATLQKVAPGVRLELNAPDIARELLDRGEADLLLTLEEYASPRHPTEFVLEEEHVVVGWSGNRAFDQPITEAKFAELGHIAVEISGRPLSTFAEVNLARIGRARNVEIVTPNFLMVPLMLLETNRIALMHERLARTFAAMIPLAIRPLPFPFPVMREIAQYHRTREHDEGLRWLIGCLKTQAAIIP